MYRFQRVSFFSTICMAFLGLLAAPAVGKAKDKIVTGVSRIAAKNPGQLEQKDIRGIMGTPRNIDVRSRKTVWVYYNDRSKLEIEWEGLPAGIKKLKFEMLKGTKPPKIDYRLPDKLKDGETTIAQAIKIFGEPAEMELKEKTQELHYVFADKNLRMFFRERVLVDFTLY